MRLARVLATAIAICGLAACGGDDNGATVPPYAVQSGLVVADLNADGRADVAVLTTDISSAPPHPAHVDVYWQGGAGFAAPARYATGPDPWGLATGDLDGDGRLDLVAATPVSVAPDAPNSNNSGGLALLRQSPSGDASYLPYVWLATGGAAQQAAISYLDADALPDVAVADGLLAAGRALAFMQRPGFLLTYATPQSLLMGTGRGAKDVVTADINGDGRNDVVVAASDGVVIFYQLGTGGFGPANWVGTGVATSGVAVADLDGDGRADMVVANAGNAPAGGTGGATVAVLLQKTAGVFTAAYTVVPDGARQLAIGDLNNDGIADVAVVCLVYALQNVPSRVAVLLQSPTQRGQFALDAVYNGPDSGNFIGIGDINGDLRKDIVVNDGPSVLLQRTGVPGKFAAISRLP